MYSLTAPFWFVDDLPSAYVHTFSISRDIYSLDMVVTQDISGRKSIINATSITNEFQPMLVEVIAETDCESATHQTDLSVSDPVLMTQLDGRLVTNLRNLDYSSSMTLVNLSRNMTLTCSSAGESLVAEEEGIKIVEVPTSYLRQTLRMSTSKFAYI